MTKTMNAKYPGRCTSCGNWFPVDTLIVWTAGAGAHHVTCPIDVAPPSVIPDATLDGSSIAAFLTAATVHLKAPKARFLAPDGKSELRLTLAKPGSKVPGALFVRINDVFIGSILTDNTVRGALKTNTRLLTLLGDIAANPAAAAKSYGALMGRCSFCNLPLTDAGSVAVGYGPICAKHYGLPHTALGTPTLTAVEPTDYTGYRATEATL